LPLRYHGGGNKEFSPPMPMHNFFTPTPQSSVGLKKACAPTLLLRSPAFFCLLSLSWFLPKNHAKAHPTVLHGLRRLVAPYEVFMLNF